MCKILMFPDRSLRGRLEAIVRDALSGHDPETQSEKLAAAMDILDRYLIGKEMDLEIFPPPGEPFTPAQVDSIKVAISTCAQKSGELLKSAVLEMATLKLLLIDAESAKR